MDKTSGVAAVANALAVMALRVQRSRETMAQEEQARAFNRKFEGEMSNRSRPVRRNAEHTRMPFILMAGRPDNGGDIGFAGGGGGMGASATQGMPRSLQGSDVPLGYDEGMVRMASAIGSDLALMHEKNAINFGAIGKSMGGVASRAGGVIRSGATKAMGAMGNAASTTRNALFGPGVKFKPPAPPKIPTPTPHVAPGVGAPVNSVGMKPPAAPKPVQPQQPAGQPYRAPAPKPAATPPPAPPPQAATPAAAPPAPPPPAPPPPAPGAQPAMSAEQQALKAKYDHENSVSGWVEKNVQPHLDRAKRDLGNGQWKGKGLALAGMAAGTYGAYRGAKALGNFMAKEPAHHASNEGGAIPAYGVNQYGVADRSTPFNY